MFSLRRQFRATVIFVFYIFIYKPRRLQGETSSKASHTEEKARQRALLCRVL